MNIITVIVNVTSSATNSLMNSEEGIKIWVAAKKYKFQFKSGIAAKF